MCRVITKKVIVGATLCNGVSDRVMPYLVSCRLYYQLPWNSYCGFGLISLSYLVSLMVIFWQEVESLHPCVRVTNGAAGISNYDNASYVVYLDKKSIFKASKLAEAIIGMFCLYFIFGVEYPRSLRKTCVFLSGHVMGFSEPQLPTVQSFFNKLSC